MNNKEALNKLYQGCAALLGSLLDDEEPKYDRIIFMGSHGTGKTTLANELSSVIDMPVVESVAREVQKNIQLLEDASVIDTNNMDDFDRKVKKNVYQKVYCSMAYWDFMRWVGAEVPCIMTRCPLDTIAYAIADKQITEETSTECLKVLQDDDEFQLALQRSLFVYLPIEFGIENDGIRPTDKKFQKDVDECMRKLIYMFGITPLVVTGTVDERMEAILVKIAGSDLAEIIMNNYREEHK